MSQCHDLSDYDDKTYPAPGPCPPPPLEVGCHDSYDEVPEDRDDWRPASTSAARSGTTRPRRAGRS